MMSSIRQSIPRIFVTNRPLVAIEQGLTNGEAFLYWPGDAYA